MGAHLMREQHLRQAQMLLVVVLTSFVSSQLT